MHIPKRPAPGHDLTAAHKDRLREWIMGKFLGPIGVYQNLDVRTPFSSQEVDQTQNRKPRLLIKAIVAVHVVDNKALHNRPIRSKTLLHVM